MDKILTSRWRNQAGRRVAGTSLCLLVSMSVIAPGYRLSAAELSEAQVTRIIKQVEVLPEQAAPRPATVKDTIRGGTAVRTGDDSRTELAFPDQTLSRLGANTTFSFNQGTRTIDLGAGAMLLYVPKGAGGAKISTAAVTAAITGTTVMIEYHPPRKERQSAVDPDGDASAAAFGWVSRKTKSSGLSSDFIKFVTLEGVAQISLNTRPGEPIIVPAGQMLLVSPDGSSVSMIEVNLAVLVSTSPLFTDFPPLGSASLIADEIAKQQAEGGPEYAGVITDPTSEYIIDLALNAFPLPIGGILGSEFGPLSTITAPVPYVISSGTQIMTAPTITTGGVVDQGKIYRTVADDGPPSDYLFGSTSSFDLVSGFDEEFRQTNRHPLAAFRFTSLRLTGNPTMIIPVNGATKLALISEGAMTSAAPGGPLTFNGINTLLLATVNGSINLTNDISFSGTTVLGFHARGAASDLILGSPINGVSNVELQAERSIQINGSENVTNFIAYAGVDFLDGAGQVAAKNISIIAGNNITFTAKDFFAAVGENPSVSLQGGATVTLDVRNDQSVFNTASFVGIMGQMISLTPDVGGTTLNFPNSTPVQFTAGTGGIQGALVNFISPSNSIEFTSQGDILVASITGGDIIQSSTGNITATGNLSAVQTIAAGNINVTGNLTDTQLTRAAGPASTIMVGGALTSRDVESTGNVNAGQVSVLLLNQNFSPSNSTLIAGAGGITPYLPVSGGVHRFNVATVQSPNGINFSGNNFSTQGSNGAILSLTAQSQVFGAGGIVGANFNGGDAAPAMSAGSGGTLAVNTGGALSVTGSTITATTGIIDTAGTPSGSGGTVNLTSSTGTVTVNNSQIKVSSDDPSGTANRRSSAAGGNININSGAVTGAAVNITNTAQLLSLLENAIPSPGGLITINATAVTGNSTVTVQGAVQAVHGGIDVRHSSDSGVISVNSNTLMADIIKIATLGDSSTLNIDGGSISAVTLLRLYAGSISASNNSTINFNASVNLTGAEIDIAAHTVNIVGAGTTVMTSSQAHVYANVANYQGSGGNGGAGTGTFTGAGATTLTLDQAPALGPPGGLAAQPRVTAPIAAAQRVEFARTIIRHDGKVSP
ncbi:MAG: FecR domain-containing protein [Verrucomicrobiota bacterium]